MKINTILTFIFI